MGLCERYLDDLDSAFSNLHSNWVTLVNLCNWMDNYYEEALEVNWRRNVKGAFRRVAEITATIMYGEPHETEPYRIPYLFRYCAGGVDMSMILSAMAKAEPHQPLLFVGYLEAYYASVWNASFDERFYAELVKKWSIWG